MARGHRQGDVESLRVATLPSPFATIRSRLHALPQGTRRVAEFALRHPEDLLRLSVTEVAERLGVSDATVVRCCQDLGYRGYRAFKISIARHLRGEAPEVYPELTADDDATTVLQKTVRLSLQALQDTLSTLKGSELEQASAAILRSRMVVLFGVGGSGGIALVAQQRLLRVGVSAFACTDPHAIGLVSYQLGRRDVAFGITHSGTTYEIIRALEAARDRGATTIVLTNDARSLATDPSSIVLLTGAAQTPLASEAGASRIVQLAAIDALCARIILCRQPPPTPIGASDEP